MKIGAIDIAIMGTYFVFVLGIGFALRRHIRTSADYFLSSRSIPIYNEVLRTYPSEMEQNFGRRSSRSPSVSRRPC